ncbi:MAG: SDR family NAD(P)-dependent oxidoreductase [Chloroflexi bacterium]|nr:SDR family NAD(P)-dependent oxidoreductase [Chloroflexota bacterium]
MGRLEGKVALVTGGSSGIGRASALAFAREGAKVVVNCNVDIEGGAKTVEMVRDLGGEAIFARADATKAAEVEALIASVVQAYGRLDCAYNNAGTGVGAAPIVDCSEEDWDRVVNVNLKGVWLCMKYEIRQMLKNGGGAIVNASSGAGLVGFPRFSMRMRSRFNSRDVSDVQLPLM